MRRPSFRFIYPFIVFLDCPDLMYVPKRERERESFYVGSCMELDGSRGACDRSERERGASLVHSIAQLRADTPLRQSARGFDVTVVLDLFPFLFQLFRVFFLFCLFFLFRLPVVPTRSGPIYARTTRTHANYLRLSSCTHIEVYALSCARQLSPTFSFFLYVYNGRVYFYNYPAI